MLENVFEFDLRPIPPFNFELTAQKPAGWSLFNAGEILDGNTFWTATRIDGIVAGIKMVSKGTVDRPRLHLTVYTSVKIPQKKKGEIPGYLAKMIGADQDLREFYEMAAKDEILKHTIEDLYGMHDTQTPYLYNSVVLGICLQMARLDRSMGMIESINRNYGDRVEFDGIELTVEPSAENISVLKEKEFAEKCKLGYRAKFLINSAKMIANGFPSSDEILSMPPIEAKKKLMELPGIGDYASDIINPHGGFPIDAWSVDVFGMLFFGKEPKNAREMIEKVKRKGIKKWGSWAWMGFFYVAQDLENLSKRLGIKLRQM